MIPNEYIRALHDENNRVAGITKLIQFISTKEQSEWSKLYGELWNSPGVPLSLLYAILSSYPQLDHLTPPTYKHIASLSDDTALTQSRVSFTSNTNNNYALIKTLALLANIVAYYPKSLFLIIESQFLVYLNPILSSRVVSYAVSYTHNSLNGGIPIIAGTMAFILACLKYEPVLPVVISSLLQQDFIAMLLSLIVQHSNAIQFLSKVSFNNVLKASSSLVAYGNGSILSGVLGMCNSEDVSNIESSVIGNNGNNNTQPCGTISECDNVCSNINNILNNEDDSIEQLKSVAAEKIIIPNSNETEVKKHISSLYMILNMEIVILHRIVIASEQKDAVLDIIPTDFQTCFKAKAFSTEGRFSNTVQSSDAIVETMYSALSALSPDMCTENKSTLSMVSKMLEILDNCYNYSTEEKIKKCELLKATQLFKEGVRHKIVPTVRFTKLFK